MSSEQPAIIVKDLYKTFKLPHEQHSGLKQAVVNIFKSNRGFEKQKVLNDISFEVKKGEFFGIVGRNGSGKSTLLKLLAGIYAPDKGLVHVGGSLTPFIELGVGFNPELTGRENVFLNGALLGFSRKQMEGMYNDIVNFAELSRFMDQKLKNYSSGMQVRLAFSIAIRSESDILLVDEVLAVGDSAFQAKCFEYFYELKERGTTVVFISHDKASLEKFCDRGVLIEKGKIIESGYMEKVLLAYNKIIMQDIEAEEFIQTKSKNKSNVPASINSTKILSKDLTQKNKFNYGEEINIQVVVDVHKEVTKPVLGVTIWKKHVNAPIFANNTILSKVETDTYKKGDQVILSQKLTELLNDGEFYVEAAITDQSTLYVYDQIPKSAKFYITGSGNPYSVMSNEEKVSIAKNAK